MAYDVDYYDRFITRQALRGEFGPEVQRQVEEGEILGHELWEVVEYRGTSAQVYRAADREYCEDRIDAEEYRHGD